MNFKSTHKLGILHKISGSARRSENMESKNRNMNFESKSFCFFRVMATIQSLEEKGIAKCSMPSALPEYRHIMNFTSGCDWAELSRFCTVQDINC